MQSVAGQFNANLIYIIDHWWDFVSNQIDIIVLRQTLNTKATSTDFNS